MQRITWKIGGEAGFGIMIAGLTFSKTLSRAGFHIVEINEYPSLIRGGHNVVAITFSGEVVSAPYRPVDILVALNKQTIQYHYEDLKEGACVVYDPDDISVQDIAPFPKVTFYGVPLKNISKSSGADLLMRNTAALGASMAILGLDFVHLEGVLTSQFSKKGEKIVAENISVARAGFDYILTNYTAYKTLLENILPKEKQMVLTGAEAVGLGALAAGMKFFAAYPMTPINGLLYYIAGVAEEMGVVYKQPEDEIAGINMAIGASFAGARSMVATSGGGFSLMVEGTSLAGMIEEAVVIVMGMRPGPATGLPTWTGQADLNFILNASHGEFPRIILAPGDVEEAFYLTAEAFNLADKFQTPTFILVDKYLCESRFSTLLYDLDKINIDRGKLLTEEEQNQMAEFARYQLTADGISPRPVPGRKGGVFRVNSDEHNEMGYSEESADNTSNMISKRMRKQAGADKIVPLPKVYGDKDADITLVGWGSTKGVVLEAIKELGITNKELRVNYLHINYINPFPTEAVRGILSKAKRVIDIEGNYNGQMAQYIRMKTGIEIKDKILKFDGRPFYPEDIIEGIKKITN